MDNYVLVESFHRANVQNRLWYVMEESDLATLRENETLLFGDRVYLIKNAEYGVVGSDNKIYSMTDGNEIGGK